jgi:Cytosolic carboxypeptidase N-terminal domain
LIYLKISRDAKNFMSLNYKENQIVNMVDIFEIRKRLMLIKTIERVDFQALYGNNFTERRYSNEGELEFHSNFESGNLALAVKLDNGIYCLEVAPDTNSVGHFNWFHFRVTGAQKDQEVTFRICNLTKEKSLMETIAVSSHKQYKKQISDEIIPVQDQGSISDINPRDYGACWENCPIVTDFFKNENKPEVDSKVSIRSYQ